MTLRPGNERVLDGTIVITALPVIGQELELSTGLLQRVVSGCAHPIDPTLRT